MGPTFCVRYSGGMGADATATSISAHMVAANAALTYVRLHTGHEYVLWLARPRRHSCVTGVTWCDLAWC
jgi:hypothetical protein